jgi:lariat debranching enzyme
MGLLNTLKPEWWFAAHLHARYKATVVHGDSQNAPVVHAQIHNPDEIRIEDDDFEDTLATSLETTRDVTSTLNSGADVPRNPDEITLDDEEEDVDVPPPPPPPPSITRFLALDKCLPNREYLEVILPVFETSAC